MQRAFLHHLADALAGTSAEIAAGPWEDDALQSKIFEVARLTPIEQPAAFKAIYRVLLDREAGPKAGNLLAFLDPAFVMRRFARTALRRESRFGANPRFLLPSSSSGWLKRRSKIAGQNCAAPVASVRVIVNDYTFTLKDGKRLRKRGARRGRFARLTSRFRVRRMQASSRPHDDYSENLLTPQGALLASPSTFRKKRIGKLESIMAHRSAGLARVGLFRPLTSAKVKIILAGARASGVESAGRIAWVAQLVEHILGKDEVAGSIPVPGSIF